MENLRQTFRTAAYRVTKDGREHVLFWAVIRSGLDPEKSFVTEHDMYLGGATSKPVRDQLPHRDAIRLVAEIDREAALKYPLADDSYRRKLFHGDDYRDGSYNEGRPWQEHPAHQEEKQDALNRLRAKKPPGFGLR